MNKYKKSEHRNQNSVTKSSSDQRTCNTGKLNCSAGTSLGKCAECQFLRTEGALDQKQDFERALGHSLQFSSGILAVKVVISNSTTGVDLKRLSKLPQRAIRELVDQVFKS